MVTKLVVLIFACFFIQDAVSSEHLPDDRVAVKNNLNDAADRQNSGKIWNWTFGNASPATNGQDKLKTSTGKGSPTDERASNAKKNAFELSSDSKVAPGNNAPAAGNKESFLKKSPDSQIRVDPRFAVPNRNLVKLRNQFHNNNNKNNYNNNDRKYESEEYDFDESEDDDSFDSQSGSSQSYDDDDDDDDDDYDDDNDLSPENKYSKGYKYSPDPRMRNEQYAKPSLANRRGSKMTPRVPLPEVEEPAMQTRSLQMQPLRGHPRRFGSVSM